MAFKHFTVFGLRAAFSFMIPLNRNEFTVTSVMAPLPLPYPHGFYGPRVVQFSLQIKGLYRS